MSELILYVGNRNYSSWSMRAWLLTRASGLPFREHWFNIEDPANYPEVELYIPSGMVPALSDGDVLVWDSLAIAEYLAEIAPEAGLWPADRPARATARAVAAEMHSGFAALRRHMPLNVRRSSPRKGRAPGVDEDIARIQALWADCRRRFGAGGPYLFGSWSAADAFYAPVVSRFRTYTVELDGTARPYADAVWSHPDVREWAEGAAREPWTNPEFDL